MMHEWQNKRQMIWRHNSFIGSAVMMQKQCSNIMTSETATASAKKYANEIYYQAKLLEKALREKRKDV